MQLFQDIANIFVQQATDGLELDFSEASIKRVDLLLSKLTEPGVAPEKTLVLSVGAYLGETTCRTLGGEWKLNEEDVNDSSIVVNGCELWPFRRVRQRLYYGVDRPLYAWYEMAKSAKNEEIQKLLQGQEQVTMIRPTGYDPLVIQVQKMNKKENE